MNRIVAILLAAGVYAHGAEPFMMMRFRGPQTDGGPIWEKTAENLIRHRAACDEVWFSTGIGVPPFSWHVEQSRRQGVAAEILRKAGIMPGLQFQATLGHGDSISALEDCSGKDWGGFTGATGVECRFCNCPRQPGFLAYVAEVARLYAAWRPSTVWIDDDLRIDNHEPASHWSRKSPSGCFCQRCIAAFSSLEAAPYDRASLVAALGTDPELLSRWERFNYSSLALVARTIAAAIHEVSPETRMGYQHAIREDGLQSMVFDALAEVSGHPVRSRPGGGAYMDHNPYDQVAKAFHLARQMKTLENCSSIESFCPEVETCPRTFNCRTARSIVAESFACLAMGMDSLSFLIVDANYETPDWYGETLFAPLAAEAPRFKAYERLNRGTLVGGLEVIPSQPPRYLASCGLPLVTGPSGRTCAALLTAADASSLPEEKLDGLFTRGVLLEGAAAQVLARRGLDRLFGGLKVRTAPAGVYEHFTDDPINAGFVCRRSSGSPKLVLVPSGENVRALGIYMNFKGEDCGISTLVGESPRGGRFAIVGCGGFALADAASDQLRRLHRMADFVSGSRLPVVFEDPVRALAVPRVAPDGGLRSLLVLNVSIDDQHPVRVRLRGVPAAAAYARWNGPGGEEKKIEIRREGTDTFATLPSIEPWKCGWLDFPAEAASAKPVSAAKKVFGEPLRIANVDQRGRALAVDGDFLYVGAGPDVSIYDTSADPLRPRLLGKVGGLGSVWQIAVQKGMVYVAARGAGLWIIDATDPARPRVRSRYDCVELATGVDVAGGVAFISQGQHGVEFVDVSDPDHPEHIALRKADESQSVRCSRGFLHSGVWGSGKTTVFDVRDMRSIREVPSSEQKEFGDMWPRHVSGRLAFVPDASNGLSCVELKDAGKTSVVDRFLLPDAECHPNWPSRIISSVAFGRGCVYVAALEYGACAVPVEGVMPESMVHGEPPSHPEHREDYPTDAARFYVWTPPARVQVHAVAVKGNVAYAACGAAGLKVFEMSVDGFKEIGSLATVGDGAFDVAVLGDRIYVAEGLGGVGVYSISGATGFTQIARVENLSRECPLALYVWPISDRWLCASPRQTGYHFIDLSNLESPVQAGRTGITPLWDSFAADRAVGGMFAISIAQRCLEWWNFLNERPVLVRRTEHNALGLNNGVCAWGAGFVCTSGAAVKTLLPGEGDAETEDGRWTFTRLPPADGVSVSGIPRFDSATKRLVVTSRIDRNLAVYDFSEPSNPRPLFGAAISGEPGLAAFHDGKVVVPAGYQGLLLQK